MWINFRSSELAPFIIASVLLVIMLAAELLSFFCGGINDFFYKLMPNKLVYRKRIEDKRSDTYKISAHSATRDADNFRLRPKALEYIYFDYIPTSTLLILYVGSFCVVGFFIQYLTYTMWGHYMSSWLASLAALIISFAMLKFLTSILHPYISNKPIIAITEDPLIGQHAKILIGQASIGKPAQALVVDNNSKPLYIMIEPDPKYIKDLKALKSSQLFTNSASESLINHDTTVVSDNDKLVITQKMGCRYLVKKI